MRREKKEFDILKSRDLEAAPLSIWVTTSSNSNTHPTLKKQQAWDELSLQQESLKMRKKN